MKGCSLIILLTLLANAHAGNSDWFNKMIVAKEYGTKPQTLRNEPQRKQKSFFKEHRIVFFYASTCPHCHQFAPILNSWAKQNKIEVLPLAFDNQLLAEFPNFLPATTEWINAAYQEKPIQYPALFVLNSKTKKLYPVGFGAMTQDELSYRMQRLIPKIDAYEGNGDML